MNHGSGFGYSDRRLLVSAYCIMEGSDALPHANAEDVRGVFNTQKTDSITSDIVQATSQIRARASPGINQVVDCPDEPCSIAECVCIAQQIHYRGSVLAYNVDTLVREIASHREVPLRCSALTTQQHLPSIK